MANKGMPTPTDLLDNNLNQKDWAKKPLNYRFEIVAMSQEIMTAAMVLAPLAPSVNPAAGIVARVDLSINPQKYSVDEGTRQNVTQTVAGAWVDAYGLALPKISLSGTTGWNPRRKKKASVVNLATINAAQAALPTRLKSPTPTGLQDFILLRNNIFRLYAVLLQSLKIDSLKSVQSQLQLRFYAWDTQDYFIVLIDDFKLLRNATRPMMYDYEMQMTVIGYPDQRPNVRDVLNQYYNPTQRLGAILNTLNSWIQTVEGIEAAVLNFEENIAAQIAAVTSDIVTLTSAIQTGLTGITAGAEAIINAPFSIVNNIALGLRNIGDSIVAVEQLPQAFINDVRAQIMETTCAVYALKTYPALFKASATANFGAAPWGNAGCSSTMGVPPSPVTSLGGVSIPGVPAPPGGLPTDMIFPTVPLSIQSLGATAEPTVSSRPKEVTIQDGDTIESIIKKNGGLSPDVASVWQQIATLNNLEYPYVAPNSEFQTQVYATGTVTFYGAPSTVVPSGTRVSYTPPSGTPIYFRTNSQVTLDATGQGTVSVTAEAPGALANIGPLSINEIVDALGDPLVIAGLTSVSNTSETVGGRIWQVLRPGDNILLPVPANQEGQEPYLDRGPSNSKNLFGRDIFLDETGDFVSDAGGDLRTVDGIENMEVAVINRLQTEPTELVKHPDYGLNLVRLVGEPGDSNAAALMKLEMKATLLQDPRIKDVRDVTVTIKDQQMAVNANLTLIDEKTVPMAATSPI